MPQRGTRSCPENSLRATSIHSNQPAESVANQALHHRMTEGVRRMPGGQIAEPSFSYLSPPPCCGLQVVSGDGAEKKMLATQIVFDGVLLVEDFKIFHPGRYWVVFILDANGKSVRF